jgi:hypothetical protein
MKKLLIAEEIAIALSIAIVAIGSIMGWPDEVIVGTVMAVVTIVMAGTVMAVVTIAPIAVAVGVVTLGIGIFMTVGTVMAVVTSIAIVALVVNEAILIILDELEIEYRWVFLSLLVEGLIVWTVLYCGPGLIKTMMG